MKTAFLSFFEATVGTPVNLINLLSFAVSSDFPQSSGRLARSRLRPM